MTSCTDRFYHLQTGVWIAYLMHFIPCEAFLWKASSHRHALLEPLFYVSDDQEEDPSQQPSAVNWLEHEPPVSITTINSGSTLLHGISFSHEWQDSFLRNGLADFCPPLCNNDLNVLVLPNPQSYADDTILLVGEAFNENSLVVNDSDCTIGFSPSTARRDSIEQPHSLRESPDIRVSSSSQNLQIHQPRYDVILDNGLFESFLQEMKTYNATLPEKQLWLADESSAFYQALSRSLHEHGIYAVFTHQSIPQAAQAELERAGQSMGLQWNFDLDGISNDRQSVSVARRFSTAELQSHKAQGNLMGNHTGSRRKTTKTAIFYLECSSYG